MTSVYSEDETAHSASIIVSVATFRPLFKQWIFFVFGVGRVQKQLCVGVCVWQRQRRILMSIHLKILAPFISQSSVIFASFVIHKHHTNHHGMWMQMGDICHCSFAVSNNLQCHSFHALLKITWFISTTSSLKEQFMRCWVSFPGSQMLMLWFGPSGH